MKLPQVLKQAVLNRDWNLVCTVYTAITGEPLSPPKTEAETLADMDIDLGSRLNPVATVELEQHEVQEEPEEDEGAGNTASGIALVGEDIEYDEEDLEEGQGVVPEKEIAEEFKDCVVRTKGEDTDDALKGSSEELGEKCKREPFRKPKKGKRKNRFKDDRRAFSRQDVTKYDKDEHGRPLSVKVATGRSSDSDNPDTSKKVKVTCKNCKRKFEVAASLATGHNRNPEYNRWKCNDCCAKGGKPKRD